MDSERTGSTSSGDASGNLPVVSFSGDEPHFKSNTEILEELGDKGYIGTDALESAFVLERVTFQHLMPYMKALDTIHGYTDPSLKLAHDLLMFDRRMQVVLLKYIGVFEAQLRAQYLKGMASRHGVYAIYDEGLFNRQENYQKFIAHYEDEVGNRIGRDRQMREAYEAGSFGAVSN